MNEDLNNVCEMLIDYLEEEYGIDDLLKGKIRKFFRENGHVYRLLLKGKSGAEKMENDEDDWDWDEE